MITPVIFYLGGKISYLVEDILSLAEDLIQYIMSIPLLTSWMELILVFLFGIPVAIQLWRIFLIKPKVSLTVLPRVQSTAHVKWYYEIGKFNDLGQKQVSYHLLKLRNKGKRVARDCRCAVLPPESIKPQDRILPMELHLAYFPTPVANMEISIGVAQWYEVGILGRNELRRMSRNLSRHDEEALLLAFAVEGISKLFLGVGDGVAILDMEPITLTLKTTADGKLHRFKIEPKSWNDIEVTKIAQ